MTKYSSRYASSPEAVKKYDTQQLREEFLIDDLMQEDEVVLVYSHYDRYIAGSAVPVKGDLVLETIDPLKAPYFLERRELGIINVGGSGSVVVEGTTYELGFKDALYIGAGNKEVVFKSDDKNNPAKFYLNSAPAHTTYPTKKVSLAEANKLQLGTMETANHRTVNQMIIGSVVTTCQLQMGMTELKPGSVWNTMPAHVHDRRMEVYFYLDIPQDQAVCHFMGQPQETRHIWMNNHQAVISPPWSIHSGSGTSNYTFIWGMAGENLDYGDMDVCKITDLR
ncbi:MULTISPECIES: 5-dehydro-4-deoxy-D-glucuronate isomerase [Flavobacterium]|jgi:4-deoxy-L-threo-5-hexosulose-uronate ketol-isomerase|uniref:4-deoxy-L-threo-5-hexosulose-uronate ketol-isomerase n=1 Tax=Flavobacterium johnsoniae (strain ATCC 17061 / DSM 2064 / JCM 8514 / BCRC 14874 / CCUG 350202 / NBRC 14942 / NCIMB 11054 / UW101) TaxID=376686 RepID=A5FBZ2_FLAJ1|nr:MULTISPECIES: 5-dehydro-4-deoxy-D-glucuronate isomerase [Flavobacterium]HEU0126540.1 5-dehydro-4-deoxy-D-glucuronate isomerase [Flavobacterium sp.]ABQ07272.1 4-deoxy-L-threo-5-hexosulose-uronate ketol-isomerase [Flavobacterium johnsoniae UW101]WDF58004.1 5-dehydro-4-deoxy-D-glucuronate isomerase [Flavobacterium sp. KACC 22758]WQG80892.1 5-dehydro-4-deoxy-D-glucuronate isomerase [Flavobacterium johnsoniae UW101]SHL17916.1 4-deoxy-L-threo-5-hexulose uronate isomerase [Flavobacterium johnsonia